MENLFDGTKSGNEILEWHRDDEVQFWHIEMQERGKNTDADLVRSSFSFNENEDGELVMPPTVQDELSASFAAERSDFMEKIDTLKSELENSIALYERYRERARVTLTQATDEQEDAQKKLHELSAELTIAHQKLKEKDRQIIELQAEKEALNMDSGDRILELEREIGHQKKLSADLKSVTERMEAELADRAKSAQSHDHNEATQRRIIELESAEKELSERIDIIIDDCERLKQREKALTADIKKRSEAARQLVMAKDEEIHKLRQKLNGSNSTPGEIPSATPPSGASLVVARSSVHSADSEQAPQKPSEMAVVRDSTNEGKSYIEAATPVKVVEAAPVRFYVYYAAFCCRF